MSDSNVNHSNNISITPVKGIHRDNFYQFSSFFNPDKIKQHKQEKLSDDQEWETVQNNENYSPNSQNERYFIKSNMDLSEPIKKSVRKDFKIKSVNSSRASSKQSFREMNEKLQDILIINIKERQFRQPSKSIK